MGSRGVILHTDERLDDAILIRFTPGKSRTYAQYSVSTAGTRLCRGNVNSIMLTVPQTIRQGEAKSKEKVAELVRTGVDLSMIPQSEIRAGKGKALDVEFQWLDFLNNYRKQGLFGRFANCSLILLHDRYMNWCQVEPHRTVSCLGWGWVKLIGRDDRADKTVKLLERIREWRDAQAVAIGRMAPAAVCSEELMKTIAKTRPRDESGLRAVGLRVGDIASLSQLLRELEAEFGWAVEGTLVPSDAPSDAQLKFKQGYTHTDPTTKNTYVQPRSRHDLGIKAYMVSVFRFTVGKELISAIAADQVRVLSLKFGASSWFCSGSR